MKAAKSPLMFSAEVAGAVAIALLMLAAEPASAIFNIPTNFGYPDKTELQDSATSPDGTWVAERYEEIYSEDTAVQISLHHPQQSPATSSQYIPFKWVGEDVVFKWLDDSNLLIAAAEGNDQGTKAEKEFDAEGNTPAEFNGVKLHYGYYTYEPDTPRIAGSQKIFTKSVTFSYRFKPFHNRGEPSNECDLFMTAPDGDYIHNISLRISAAQLYPNGEWQHTPKTNFSINIGADKEVRQSLGFATGAKVENFSPNNGKPIMGRIYKTGMWPHTHPARGWDLVYLLQDQNDLQTIIHKIKNGSLHVKVGFWLDNAEVIYTSTAPSDASSVEAFERCIKENKIFTNATTAK